MINYAPQSRHQETAFQHPVKELVLLIEWARPLHVVVTVDEIRSEERILTVYEPDADRWDHHYRRRR